MTTDDHHDSDTAVLALNIDRPSARGGDTFLSFGLGERRIGQIASQLSGGVVRLLLISYQDYHILIKLRRDP